MPGADPFLSTGQKSGYAKEKVWMAGEDKYFCP